MKILRKVNKGLVLTVIVLLVLIIYLISVETKRNAEKPKIEEVCREYIALINEYAVIPQDYQKLYNSNSLTNTEEADRINGEVENSIKMQMNKLNEKLKEKMIDNDLAIKMQRETVEEFIENNNNVFESIIIKFDREITKVKKFAFDDDQVTVTFDTKIDQDVKYLEEGSEENKELSKKNDFDFVNETITLQKIDGIWKVVYADLQYQSYMTDNISTVNMSF